MRWTARGPIEAPELDADFETLRWVEGWAVMVTGPPPLRTAPGDRETPVEARLATCGRGPRHGESAHVDETAHVADGRSRRSVRPEVFHRAAGQIVCADPNGPVLMPHRRGPYSNLSVFREKVLQPAHDENLIHYDRKSGLVHLSPIAAEYVQANLSAWMP